ncbi:hypothetical protein MMC07_004934 [Pseudocyphellaria aurata]|nr:hypothetical protein [Pseudocyphellaria aurata]
MYWLVAVAIIDLLSFGHAQKYDTSGAITLDVSPTATTSCGGCNIDVHNFGFEWHDQAYTHVAATIVKFVNNATNVTITSTVQGDVYTLPAGAVAGAALVVSDSVITTVIGGTLYTLTYPKRYMGVGGIERYSQTPIINGNRTVKCVVSKTAMTHPFLLREDVSNGLELSAFINRDIDRNCALLGASPPRVLVRVSSLTATTTNYINPLESRTSATNVASPAVTPGSPTAPQTASPTVSDLPTVLANPSARKTADSLIATKSTSSKPTPIGSVDLASPATISSGFSVAGNTLTRDVGISSSQREPQAASSIVSDRPTVLASLPAQETADSLPIATESPPSETNILLRVSPATPRMLVPVESTLPVTISSLPPIAVNTQTRIPAVKISYTGVALDPPDTVVGSRTSKLLSSVPSDYAGIIGSRTIALPSYPSLPVIDVVTATPTEFLVDGVTLAPNGPLVTVSGTPISLGSSDLVIGTSTFELPAEPTVFAVDGQKFTAVDRIENHRDDSSITVRGTPVLLEPSGVVIGSKTIALPSHLSFPVLTVGGKPLTANPTGFVVGSVTLSPNGPLATVSGTPISLGSSNLVIGTSTIELPAEPSVFTVDGQKFTVKPPDFAVGSTEIHRDDSSITVRGTPVLLEPSGVVIGSKTIALPSSLSFPVLTVGGKPLTANPTGFVVGSVTVSPNGPLVTVSGTPISLGSSDLVIGTSTFELPAEPTVFAVDGQKFTAVDRIENHRDDSSITVRGTPVMLEPSGIVIGSKTIALPSHLSFPVLTVGGKTFTANPTEFVVGSVTLSPNGPLATISGTPISLGSSNLVIGTSTIDLPAEPSVFTVDGQPLTVNPSGFSIGGSEILRGGSPVTISGKSVSFETSGISIATKTRSLSSSPSLPVLKVAGISFTANPTGFHVGSVTLSPNGPLATISGTPISLGSSNLVIGNRTIDLPAESSVFTVDGQALTANPSGLSIGGTEIHRGGSPVTISGTPISLGSSALIVGSSTVPLPSLTKGLGPAILSGLGIAVTPTASAGTAAGNGTELFTGTQIKIEAPMILLTACVALTGLI